MDSDDRKLLNLIQIQFPLVYRPFPAMGQALDIDEEEVPERLCRLKLRTIVRQIGADFDTRRFGYKTTLVAFAKLVKT